MVLISTRALTKGAITRRPDHGSVLFDQLLRRAEMVVLGNNDTRRSLSARTESVGPGGIRPVAITFEFVARSIVFRDQPFIGIEERGSGSAHLFP